MTSNLPLSIVRRKSAIPDRIASRRKSLLPPDAAYEARRRSTRVELNVPIVVSGVDAEGSSFEAPGETQLVNKQGAKIRLLVGSLERHMVVSVTIPTLNRSRRARVVWVEETDDARKRSRQARLAWLEKKDGGKGQQKFGIELENPENFWDVYFPPSDWQELTVWEEPEPAVAEPAHRPSADSGSAETPGKDADRRVGSRLAAAGSDLPDIPARGVEVFVRGMSSARMPCMVSVEKMP